MALQLLSCLSLEAFKEEDNWKLFGKTWTELNT